MTPSSIVPRADYDMVVDDAVATHSTHDIHSSSTTPLEDSTLIVEPTEEEVVSTEPQKSHGDHDGQKEQDDPGQSDKGKVQQWAKKNPGKAAFFGITGLVIAAPALVATPVLGALGFTAKVQLLVKGSIAAGAQAAGGPAAAGGLFATLQSAAMGGYGVAVVSGVVQGTAAIGAGAKLYHDKVAREKE